MKDEIESSDSSISLAPLTHSNTAGDVYVRAPTVERQVIAALALTPMDLRTRLALNQRASSDFLSEECIVYLLRHYVRREDNSRVNELAAALLRRCALIVRKSLSTLGPAALEEGRSEIVTQLFGRILDFATNRGDFLQVRFWVVLKRLCVQEFQRQLRQHKENKNSVNISQLLTYDEEVDEESELIAVRLTEGDKRRLSTATVEEVIVDDDLGRAALKQLEEPFRSAYLLRHLEGWPIEDQDPAVPTISRHFGKTPRTISNWLATADETLARWRGGQK